MYVLVDKRDDGDTETGDRKEEAARSTRKMSAKEKLKLKLEKKKSSTTAERIPKLSRQSSRVEERLKVLAENWKTMKTIFNVCAITGRGSGGTGGL